MSDRLKQLAARLPDLPRWVEVRSMLLSGRCEVYGLEEAGALCLVARDPEVKLSVVVGHPACTTIQQAVAAQGGQGSVVAPPESFQHVADALPGWKAEMAALHLLEDASRLPKPEAVRLLTCAEVEALSHVPADLKDELVLAVRRSPIASVCVSQLPVSFCYAGSQTETLWDISIDTLAEYRQRGYAAHSVAFLLDYFRAQGRQPVWGALESNAPSMRLAAKLGFVPVDQVVVFAKEVS